MNMKEAIAPIIEKNKLANGARQTTAEDVADLVEYALNEAEPKIKTKRGIGSSIEVKFGGRKFLVNVVKPFKPRKTKRGSGFGE